MKISWTTEFTVPPDDQDGTTGVKFEDSGHAAIMYHPMEDDPPETGGDGCFFVRLHSWQEPDEGEAAGGGGQTGHPLFRSLMGRRVRVTVETVGEDRVPPRPPRLRTDPPFIVGGRWLDMGPPERRRDLEFWKAVAGLLPPVAGSVGEEQARAAIRRVLDAERGASDGAEAPGAAPSSNEGEPR